MVVPFAAAGGTDLLGRIVGKRLSEVLGQQVIIENIAGAGGMVGSARVVKAPPDGYQFVVGTTADAINQTLYKTPLYNFATDLVPVGLIANQPTILLTRKDFPAADFKEFAAYAKANQSTLQYASAGTGSTGHLFCNLMNVALGINITHVPYRGGGPAMQDLIAGRTDYICTLSATAKPAIDGNLVKAMAILSRERSPMLPDLPTAHEQGLPISTPIPGSASSSPGTRRSRSCAGSTRPPRWPSTRRPCRSGSRRSSPAWCRRTGARPNTCRNTSRARPPSWGRRSGPPASRRIERVVRRETALNDAKLEDLGSERSCLSALLEAHLAAPSRYCSRSGGAGASSVRLHELVASEL